MQWRLERSLHSHFHFRRRWRKTEKSRNAKRVFSFHPFPQAWCMIKISGRARDVSRYDLWVYLMLKIKNCFSSAIRTLVSFNLSQILSVSRNEIIFLAFFQHFPRIFIVWFLYSFRNNNGLLLDVAKGRGADSRFLRFLLKWITRTGRIRQK